MKQYLLFLLVLGFQSCPQLNSKQSITADGLHFSIDIYDQSDSKLFLYAKLTLVNRTSESKRYSNAMLHIACAGDTARAYVDTYATMIMDAVAIDIKASDSTEYDIYFPLSKKVTAEEIRSSVVFFYKPNSPVFN